MKNKKLYEEFDTIRFSDDALQNHCQRDSNELQQSTNGIKQHTPEEISFWVNFGYFKENDTE